MQVATESGGGQVPSACQYSDESLTSQVTVLLHTYSDGASARADFDALSNGYEQEGNSAVPIAGVGDVAAIFRFGSSSDAILFAKHSAFVAIAVQPAATDDALTTAASAAAGRLP